MIRIIRMRLYIIAQTIEKVTFFRAGCAERKHMRTYKLTIAYDGSRFRGWQRQPDTGLTVQGILEREISALSGRTVEVNGSGRTDGGVHASGQTASVILPGKVDEWKFREDLNRKLPEDIRVRKVELMKNGFHARYSARGKRYEYTVDTGEKADVFSRKYAFHYPETPDIEAMKSAAGYLCGLHDFAGFTDRPDEKSTNRRIYAITIRQDGSILRIEYRGSGFMYHMVRILTGTLLEAGSGKRSIQSVKDVLESGVRADAGFLAPACGLCLKEVYYDFTKNSQK